MDITFNADQSNENVATSQQEVPVLTDVQKAFEKGFCSEVYYKAFVDGEEVDWLEVKDGMIVLQQPQDIKQIGEHRAELKLFYPSELLVVEELQLGSQGDESSDQGDILLDSNEFTILIKPFEDFTLENPLDVNLEFIGIGGDQLPPWVVKPGQRYRYDLPDLAEAEGVEITVFNSLPDSPLNDCDCYELKKNKQKVDLTLPEDWPTEEAFDVLTVLLSHGSNNRIYSIPITVLFDDTRIRRK